MEAVGTARLTDLIPAERAVAASVSSREIRDILKDAQAAPELTLDVVPGDGSHEHGTISMTWSREDLEQLLEAATGDNVVLTFDRNELEAVLADVEAHGLRARAAIFAVVAGGALGTGAGIANAMVPGAIDGGGSQPAAVSTTDTSQAALQARSEALNVQYGLDDSSQAALQARSEAMNQQYGLGDTSQAALQARSEAMNAEFGLAGSPSEATVTDASTSGYVAPTQGDDAQAALQARSQALNEEFGLTAGGQNDPAVKALEARGEAMNAQFGLGGSPSDATVTDASTGGYTTPSSGGSGIEIQAPSTDDAAIAGAALGAALLTIAGASFAARKTTAPRPA